MLSHDRKNLKRIINALSLFKPRPRDLPKELPFIFDEQTLLNDANLTFKTEIGDIDLLAEVDGVGTFKDFQNESVTMSLYGYEVNVLSIEGLIKAKRAAGRTKGLLVLPELEALQELLSEE